ncbi:MAG: hypothetical protein JWR68_1217 [Polaromonas sp.]|nr:hypothetical protein [Polaromonas sp.]
MATSSSNPTGSGVPLGKASSDEPANTLPAEPSNVTPAHAQADQGSRSKTTTQPVKKPGNEEPEMALEEDVPSDGNDEVGEAMIRELPVRPELSRSPDDSK